MDDAELELGGGEIFWTHPDRPRGPPSLLYRGTEPYPGSKAAGALRWSTTLFLAPGSSMVVVICLPVLRACLAYYDAAFIFTCTSIWLVPHIVAKIPPICKNCNLCTRNCCEFSFSLYRRQIQNISVSLAASGRFFAFPHDFLKNLRNLSLCFSLTVF